MPEPVEPVSVFCLQRRKVMKVLLGIFCIFPSEHVRQTLLMQNVSHVAHVDYRFVMLDAPDVLRISATTTVETYKELRTKTHSFFMHPMLLEYDWVAKTDMDTFMVVPNVISELRLRARRMRMSPKGLT